MFEEILYKLYGVKKIDKVKTSITTLMKNF